MNVERLRIKDRNVMWRFNVHKYVSEFCQTNNSKSKQKTLISNNKNEFSLPFNKYISVIKGNF